MFKKRDERIKEKNEKIKEEIKLRLLRGVDFPSEDECLKKEALEKIIDNIATEFLNLNKLATQSMHSAMM